MNKLSYGWAAVVGLVEIFITVAVFDGIYDPFETKVLAILVITYATIRTVASGLATTILALSQGLEDEFRKLNKAELEERSEDEREWAEEQKKETREAVKKAELKITINLIIVGIMSLIAIFNLLGAL